MNDELLNRRVLREISKAGRPLSCNEIKVELYGLSDDRLNEVRRALEVLMKDGDVVAVGALYAKAHGGYNPDGGTAA
jgi:hypothetical protein